MSGLLRDGLLAGLRVAGHGAPDLVRALVDLGAVEAEPARVHVVDVSDAFADGGLLGALEAVWERLAAPAAELVAAGGPGKLILIAPAPNGAFAEGARAGIENLARTLSTEWARHGITAVAVLPGRDTDAVTLAETVAYLASRAGDYFSGCAIRLDPLTRSSRS